MNKKLLITGGIIVVLLAGLYVGLEFFLGSAVKAGVNAFGPKITQTKVELASATISPLSGSGTLKGLTVGNPAGWNAERAFYLGHVHIKVKPFSIFGDHIVIDEISIDQPEFTYETKVIASNIGDLLKNIEAVTGSADKSATATTKTGKPIKFEVKKFSLSGGTVAVGVGPAAIKLPLPPLVLTDLGTREGGITPDQLTMAIMRRLTPSIVGAAAKGALQLGGTGGAAAVEGVKKTGEAIKSIFGGGKE
jgi:hypothetical protein